MLLRDRSIRAKLVLIMGLVSSLALVIAGGVMVAYDVVTFKRQRVNELATQAEMLGAIASAALNFDDPKAAREYLSALRARPKVSSAVVYDAHGRPFAIYQRQEQPSFKPPDPNGPEVRLQGDDLLLFKPIRLGEERIGTVHLRSGLGLRARLQGYGGIVLAVLAGALGAAVALSGRLQGFISRPLLELADVAHRVIEGHDYSLRALPRGADEVGVLADALNQMLAQIQQREAALRETNEALQGEISDHKAAREEISLLNQSLERRVAERTTELLVANQELESFSYSVSHDLRAPLRAIDGFSQALLEDCEPSLDAAGKDYLRRIRAAAQRMGQLIDDLINLSRVSRSEMAAEEVDLAAMARKVIEDLRPQQGDRVVRWEVQEPLRAWGDPRLLQIALENLLGNALKFTRPCDVAHIEFGTQAEGEGRTFYVRDNGAGFDMAHANRLFGAFQRLHSTQEFPGIGIGLATVQRVIHRHGGRIRAEARPGAGATFYFSLPLADTHHTEAA